MFCSFLKISASIRVDQLNLDTGEFFKLTFPLFTGFITLETKGRLGNQIGEYATLFGLSKYFNMKPIFLVRQDAVSNPKKLARTCFHFRFFQDSILTLFPNLKMPTFATSGRLCGNRKLTDVFGPRINSGDIFDKLIRETVNFTIDPKHENLFCNIRHPKKT